MKVAGVPDDNLTDALVQLFKTKEVKSKDVHALADKLGVSIEQLEEVAFKKLSALLKGVGKHSDVPDEKFDKDQLAMGVKVEQEHTDDPYVAKIIAKDHLMELPDYYSRLKKMEHGND
jgi:Protein of unknown function (DUF5661)